ncbi:HIT domain-containing protein [Candidatus Woesearchaeota archaeon]|nr:HIT domain-containing protein [Candidatus Woesearchaeota archaeon]
MAEQQKCILCDIIREVIPAKKFYEDDDIICILDFNGANAGHSFILPKEHIPILEQIPNFLVGKLFNTANKVSSAIFDVLKVQGTNIFVSNGVAAGQKVAHALVQVIPRMENDGVQLSWPPKQLTEEEMSTVELKLKDEIGRIGFGKEAGQKANAPAAKKAPQPIEEAEGEENYLVRQMERIP